jgi:hypothetical protein
MPRPTYEFGGKVAPGGSQFILHFIGTNGLQAGVLRLKAAIQLKQDEIESNTVSVVLTEPAEKPPQVFTPDEFVIIHNQVTPAHNLFRGRSGNPELNKVAGELVQKAMQAANATTDCEYALYFAVLQCADKDASPEETVLADRACSALVRLFPKSWLRAHAFAALARRDLRRARQTIWEASKLAEAYPLLDNLGLHSF